MEFKNRFLQAMLLMMDMSRGTLWRVKEPVLIRNIAKYVDRGRTSHIGLSIRKRPIRSVADIVPMLIGTSKRSLSTDFYAEGCFGEHSKRRTFFRLRPFQIPLADAYDERRGAVMVEPNPHKRRLTPPELARLDAMLAAKGAAS